MDAQKQRARLLRNFAYLPGSRDRSGGPVLVINLAQSGSHNGKDKATGSTTDISDSSIVYEDIVSLLGYFAQIPDDNARRHGFTVLIDGRRTHLKHLRRALRACQHALYRQIRQVIIVQPEKFLEQQKLNFDLIKEAYEFKTTLTSVHKLSKYIDVAQLPESLGGSFHYNAQTWADMRERYETFIVKASNWIQTTKRHEKTSLNESADSVDSRRTIIAPEELFKMGDELLDDLLPVDATSLKSGNADWNAAAQKIETLLREIKVLEDIPPPESRRPARNPAYSAKLIDDYAQGVHNLLAWICGAGEKWLLTLHEIGESADDAKQLVKDHIELENKSKEMMEQVSDLSELANRLLAEFPDQAPIIENNKEQLGKVSRAFCARIDRQKRIALQSVLFHEKLNEFSHTTDLLLESLCTEVKVDDIASVEKEKSEVEKRAEKMEKIYHNLIETGVSFIDELYVDEANSVGRAVTRDYSAGIVHIRERMDETRDRRRRCQDLLDVRRLKLQQLLQLYTCEKDGDQATKWIEELHETLLNDYDGVGCSDDELGLLRGDRMKLEETARSTYEYGKQLCQVALVLRRSLRMEVQPQLALNQKLETAWGRFCRAVSESEASLNITQAFHSTIKEVSRRLDDLFLKLNSSVGDPAKKTFSLYALNSERKRLAGDTRELKHIAEMLIKQINSKSPRKKNRHQRPDAAQDIRKKLEDVEERLEKLDNFWVDGALATSSEPRRIVMPQLKSLNNGSIAEKNEAKILDDDIPQRGLSPKNNPLSVNSE